MKGNHHMLLPNPAVGKALKELKPELNHQKHASFVLKQVKRINYTQRRNNIILTNVMYVKQINYSGISRSCSL